MEGVSRVGRSAQPVCETCKSTSFSMTEDESMVCTVCGSVLASYTPEDKTDKGVDTRARLSHLGASKLREDNA